MSSSKGFQPRTSRLAGKHPVEATPPVMPALPVMRAPQAKAVEQVEKVTLRLPVELAGKVRMAFQQDVPATGVTSLSKWVAAVLEKEIAEREATSGELGQLPAGSIVRGWNAH